MDAVVVNLDGDSDSRMALSLQALKMAATGSGRGARAAKAGIDTYERERAAGASVEDAVTLASGTIRLEMRTP